MHECMITAVYIYKYSGTGRYMYLKMHTWKANEREAKQLKLLLHLHSQVYMCQKGPPALGSLQKLLHEWPELHACLCPWKPEF